MEGNVAVALQRRDTGPVTDFDLPAVMQNNAQSCTKAQVLRLAN